MFAPFERLTEDITAESLIDEFKIDVGNNGPVGRIFQLRIPTIVLAFASGDGHELSEPYILLEDDREREQPTVNACLSLPVEPISTEPRSTTPQGIARILVREKIFTSDSIDRKAPARALGLYKKYDAGRRPDTISVLSIPVVLNSNRIHNSLRVRASRNFYHGKSNWYSISGAIDALNEQLTIKTGNVRVIESLVLLEEYKTQLTLLEGVKSGAHS